MDREQLDKYLEGAITALVLVLLLGLPLAFGGRPQTPIGAFLDPFLMDPFLAAQWLCLPILALWTARLWIAEKPRLLWPPICWAVLAFAVYAAFRYFTADIEYVARQEVIRIAIYVFLFFVIVNNLHRQETVQWVAFSLIAVSTLIAGYALFQFFTQSDRVWHVLKPYPKRGSGTYICPNHLGGLLELVLPLAMAYALTGRVKAVTRILLGYAALVMLAGILVTLSRGTWIAVALALVGFFGILLTRRAYRVPAMVVLVLFVAAGAYVFPKSYALQARASRIVSNGKISDDARFSLWKPALEMWRTAPWLGVGPAHFDYRFGQFRPEDLQLRPDRAHNDFLNALTDWGMVGTALLASIWGLLTIGLIRTWPHVNKAPRDIGGSSHSNKFAFFLGASVGLLAILLHSWVDFNLHIPANALIVVSLMALVSSHLRFSSSDCWETARGPAKLALSLALLGGILLLGHQAWRRTAEYRWLAKAALAPAFSLEQAQLLQRALAVEPANFETDMALGEALRKQSSAGPDNYRELAEQAMQAFARCMALNPYHAPSTWRYGWCLDWLDRGDESAPFFSKAEALDGNSYFVVANIGIHHVQHRRYATAKKWFERSQRLYNDPVENPIAFSYLRVVEGLIEVSARGPASLNLPRLEPNGPQTAPEKNGN